MVQIVHCSLGINSSMVLQLALYVRPAKLLPAFATRVAVTSFSMKGELLLDFHTSPVQVPGISSLGVSFAQPPAIDFNFHTFALAFADLPFLLDMLKVRWCCIRRPVCRLD